MTIFSTANKPVNRKNLLKFLNDRLIFTKFRAQNRKATDKRTIFPLLDVKILLNCDHHSHNFPAKKIKFFLKKVSEFIYIYSRIVQPLTF